MPEQTDKRVESLRELAALMSTPDVARFLSVALESGAPFTPESARVAAQAACGGCCILFGGGRL